MIKKLEECICYFWLGKNNHFLDCPLYKKKTLHKGGFIQGFQVGANAVALAGLCILPE